MREPLSVVVITKNVEHQLPACLVSAGFADEIVVVDSGSTDGTIDLARKHGARVLHQDWLGFGRQKHFAVTQARHRWVLCLDADERVTEELRATIVAALSDPQFHSFRMPRRNRFMGRWLRHGEGYPDLSLRLFHREHANWSDDDIHEKVVTDSPVGTLEGDLLHESENGIDDYLAKQNRYTTLQAQRLHALGARANVVQLVLNPLARFIKFYVLRLGFLDGVPGLVHISIGCFNTYTKYAKLLELQRRAI